MAIPRTAAAMGAAALVLTTVPADAATPIRSGWYEASGTTAIVAGSGRSARFVIAPRCSDARFRASVAIRIHGDALSYRGRIVSLPTRRDPRVGAIEGTATIRGRFATRTRLRAIVTFKAASCEGRFTRTLLYVRRSA